MPFSTRLRAAVAVALLIPGGAFALPTTASSPIDIRPEYTRYDPNLSPLLFNYRSSVDVTLVNTGSPDEEATVRTDFAPGDGVLTIGGVEFQLLQFHLHVDGEHAINGVRSEMELHQVHRAADGTLAVVARLIDIGAENMLLAATFDNLPEEEGETFALSNFNLAGLAAPGLQSYRHGGSLTTPPFTGGVLWTVIAEPLTVSAGQVEAFRSLFPEGNSRELQPFGGVVLTDVPGFAAVPEPTSWALLVLGFGVVGVGARRQRAARLAAV